MKSLVKETLDWCNQIREEQQLPTLVQMPLGRRGSALSCPVAEAIAGRVGKIDYNYIGIHNRDLPSYVTKFIKRFDKGWYSDLRIDDSWWFVESWYGKILLRLRGLVKSQ